MKRSFGIALILGAAWSQASTAGVYTDDLSKCLVAGTTQSDRFTLAKWVFAAMSQHPAVADLTKVSEADLTAANKATGALFTKLLTETCSDKAKSAIKYEGAFAIQGAFQVLGQVAMGDLLSDPNVGKVLAELENYLDAKKFEDLKE